MRGQVRRRQPEMVRGGADPAFGRITAELDRQVDELGCGSRRTASTRLIRGDVQGLQRCGVRTDCRQCEMSGLQFGLRLNVG